MGRGLWRYPQGRLGYTERVAGQVTTVDSMNLPKMRLLKADVEGMELDVIKGAVKTIK